MEGMVIKDKNGEHPLGDVGQLILFLVFLAVWIADTFFLQWSTFLAAYVPLAVRLALLGLALVLTALLFKSAGTLLRHHQRQDRVFETGAFRYVRHPLYLGILCFNLGLAAATLSLISLALLACIFIFYNYIASYEEKLMVAWFGEAYTNYKARTAKWIPKITGRRG
jgi:protein-S-isoprenylcysteine O-methyltransferase Ste14